MFNNLSSYEELCKELMINAPPRSTLFSLAPIGIATPLMECLSSYVLRLAREHSITVNKLVRFSLKHSTNLNYTGGNRNKINEMDFNYNFIVEGLELLTMRNDIRYLSVFAWKGFIKRGSIRLKKAWCPLCFNDWNNQNKVLYEPLIWQFAYINTCYLHHTPLVTECWNCGQNLEVCYNFEEIGYCPHCNCSLGLSSSEFLINTKMSDHKEVECLADLIINTKDIERLNPDNNLLDRRISLDSLIQWAVYDETTPFELMKNWADYEEHYN